MTQKQPRIVKQLESYIRKQWDNIPLIKVQELVSIVFTYLLTAVKRRGATER